MIHKRLMEHYQGLVANVELQQLFAIAYYQRYGTEINRAIHEEVQRFKLFILSLSLIASAPPRDQVELLAGFVRWCFEKKSFSKGIFSLPATRSVFRELKSRTNLPGMRGRLRKMQIPEPLELVYKLYDLFKHPKASLPMEVTAYRGMTGLRILSGIIEHYGFISTSLSPEVALEKYAKVDSEELSTEPVLVTIRLRSGTRALYLPALSPLGVEEYELLLPPGARVVIEVQKEVRYVRAKGITPGF